MRSQEAPMAIRSSAAVASLRLYVPNTDSHGPDHGSASPGPHLGLRGRRRRTTSAVVFRISTQAASAPNQICPALGLSGHFEGGCTPRLRYQGIERRPNERIIGLTLPGIHGFVVVGFCATAREPARTALTLSSTSL